VSARSFKKIPNITLDERLLGVQLEVQEGAARAYITELMNVGLLTEDCKATPLAQKWRLDETYSEAAKEILAASYPESLLHIAPPGDAERQKIVSWFLREGLGQGAAGNKAATYLLISSPSPNEAPRNNSKGGQSEGVTKSRPKRLSATEIKATEFASKPIEDMPSDGGKPRPGKDTFPLNINVQIHISADAGTEQIESIFQAMRRYLYDATDT
jgi:hypothetical protein